MDTKIKLRVQGLTNSQIQSGAYALILAEENGARRVPIIVGTSEAQSIAIALEHITPPRPLTHDLFMTFAQAFGIQLREVFIYKFEDGVFYSGTPRFTDIGCHCNCSSGEMRHLYDRTYRFRMRSRAGRILDAG